MAVVLQHDFIADVGTKIAAPLVKEGQIKRVTRLHPVIDFDGQRFIIVTERAAGVPTVSLGRAIGSARARRDEIMAALDFLFTGF